MSRSGLPKAIFLEFVDKDTEEPRIMGTDSIFYVDGRWSRWTAEYYAHEKAERVSKGRNVKLIGYSLPGWLNGDHKVYKF